MKKIFIIGLVLSLIVMNAVVSHAQWAKTYGGSNVDGAFSLQETSDGSYAWAGLSASFAGDATNDYNAWVVKLDSSGTISWEKEYGGGAYDLASCIQEIVGGYIVAGYTESFGTGGPDVWVLKLNTDGSIAWEKAYGDIGTDEATCVRATSDGGYIVAGRTTSFGDGDSDMWVVKLDGVGDIQWQHRYGGSDLDRACCIEETSPDGYIVAGDTWSSVSGMTNDSDIAMMKLDSSGYISWQKTYGDIDNDSVGSIQQTSDGGYVVAGSTRSFGGISKAWVLKLTSVGAITWQKTYGDLWSYASSAKETAEGGYIVAGDTYDYGTGWSDTWVLKLTSTGAITWQKTYGGSDVEWTYDVEETTTGDYLMAGTTYSFGAGERDAWVLRIDSTGDIPDCTIIDTSTAVASDTTISAEDAYLTVTGTTGTASDTTATVGDTSADESTICPGEDTDEDGVLDVEDNCWAVQNPDQLDSNENCPDPPYTSDPECGDACESANQCQADFDDDGNVYPSDLSVFLGEYGRTDCIANPPCVADFDADGNVYPSDLSVFLGEYGRTDCLE